MTTMNPTVAPMADEVGTYGDQLRVAAAVWHRELLRYRRTKTRILTGLVQPLLFLLVFGFGLNDLIGINGGFDFKKFMFPGVIGMSVVSTAIFSAISIVWDREFGFLREMLVAPVQRSAIVWGKIAGGATIATLQGCLMLALAPLIDIRLTVVAVVEVVAIAALMAVALTAFGVFVGSRLRRIEGFQIVMQVALLPMLFLAGLMFPLGNLPSWLTVLTRLDPLTYVIAPLRDVIFDAQHMPPAAIARFPAAITIFGHRLSNSTDLAVVSFFTVLFIVLAVRGFSRTE
ncbi:MAG: ABC transporter permease [Frankiaceae bacterium]|nr:ABC transporter permease [Frankiaceae bacterium]